MQTIQPQKKFSREDCRQSNIKKSFSDKIADNPISKKVFQTRLQTIQYQKKFFRQDCRQSNIKKSFSGKVANNPTSKNFFENKINIKLIVHF
ncbi:hypothetical protein CGC58_11395 [Capnocytophaga stomatis]|uniref:Uncharacterized protein n=1 Tax=Capnocytophaga stomatis TaxID=1848904 RepID=A0A250FYN5_9FLAO|nr:hypothetical protein CGC58_11395 [Capnocytophaga stomatis]